MSSTPKGYTKLVAALREHCPPILPVKIRRVPNLKKNQDCVGWCSIEKKNGRPYFDIEIDSSLRGQALYDTVTHEWGHALGYTTKHPSFNEHGPEWGINYARAYNVMVAIVNSF